MAKAALIGYSVLKKLHDSRRDVLDAYAPFVEFALASVDGDYTDIESIKEFVRSNLGLDIPTNTTRSILRRLAKLGAIKQLDGYNYLEVVHLQDSHLENFNEALERTTRERNDLIAAFRDFANLYEQSDAETLEIIADFTLTSLPDLGSSSPIVPTSPKLEHVEFARFLNHIKTYDDARYQAFRSIYYGAVLSRLSEIGGLNSPSGGASGVTIYLDSNILFRVLQLQNPIFNNASLEVVRLLQRHGFKVKCFQESVREMRSVLAHRHRLMRDGIIAEHVPEIEANRIDGIIGAFYRRKMTLSTIEDLIQKLELKIEALGIKVDDQDFLSHVSVPSSVFDRYYEAKLRRQMRSKKIDEYDRDYDLDTLVERTDVPAHIHRMVRAKCELDTKIVARIQKWRSDHDVFRLADSKAIFLTCDFQLYSFNTNLAEPARIPEVMLEEQLTNILWIADPDRSGDVPLETIIASYNATTFFDYRLLKQLNDYLARVRESEPDRLSLVGDIFRNQAVMAELRRMDEGDTPVSDTEFESLIELAQQATEQRVDELKARIDKITSDREAAKSKANSATMENEQLKEQNTELRSEVTSAGSLVVSLLHFYYWLIPVVATVVILALRPAVFADVVQFFSSSDEISPGVAVRIFLPEIALLWLWGTALWAGRRHRETLNNVSPTIRLHQILLEPLLYYGKSSWTLILGIFVPFILGIIVNRVS